MINLEFNPPITYDMWPSVAEAMLIKFPELSWSSGDKVSNRSIPWLYSKQYESMAWLHVYGYCELTFTMNDHNMGEEGPQYDGWEYLGLDMDTDAAFNSLYESEEDDFEWAKDIVNSMILTPSEEVRIEGKPYCKFDSENKGVYQGYISGWGVQPIKEMKMVNGTYYYVFNLSGHICYIKVSDFF